MSTTRRSFLKATSFAITGAALSSKIANGQLSNLNLAASQISADDLLDEPMSLSDFRFLAKIAVDAAKSAGATYADVRIAERRMLSIGFAIDPLVPIVDLGSNFTYGVRVLVNGAWGFIHGTVPSPAAITASAKDVVSTARGYGKIPNRGIDLASTPIAVGEWATLCELDPFKVPLGDQAALLHSYRAATERVRYGFPLRGPSFRWLQENRVFASSEGALTTQLLRRAEPEVYACGDVGMGIVLLKSPSVTAGSGGYELVAKDGLQNELKSLTEEAVRLASFPRRPLDVGRYSVVFDGMTFGAVLGQTIGPALELDRVLGYETDASGTSFLSPPSEMLGATIVSPMLSVTGNRLHPSISAVKWDDEGVLTREYSVIAGGRLANYHTSRQTAAELNSSTASVGCAVAPMADNPTLVRAPHLTAHHADKSASVEDLCRGMSRGILVRDVDHVATDQELSSGQITFGVLGGTAFEIVKGKIARRLVGNGLQFNTGRFWKSLSGLGDSSTMRNNTFEISKGQPWRGVMQGASAPAGIFKEINVVLTKVNI